jgi:hypothetical protein
MFVKRNKTDDSDSNKNVRKWKNLLPNVPCFIIGNGPSISKQPLKLISNYFTIGINRSFMLFDPTILMWQDIECWYTHRTPICNTSAIKFCTRHSDPHNKFYHYKLEGGGFRLPSTPSMLNGSGSTGPLAFQLAWVLGCNPIILLGMDCRIINNKTDFYGNNPFHKSHTMSACNRGLNWIRNANHGRTIYNCSESDVFADKKCSLEETILKIKKEYNFSSRDECLQKLKKSSSLEG